MKRWYPFRQWLRRRVLQPLDRWLTVPPAPRKQVPATAEEERAVRDRMLRELGRDLPLPRRALGSATD